MNPDPKAKEAARGTQGGTGGEAPVEVAILNMAFSPREVTIRAGQSVRWINKERILHSVIANPGTHGCQPASPEDFTSYPLEPDMAFEYKFNNPGTFHYHCLLHGCGMAGSVTVT
ncbi:MAG TPA: plastocyanin/azurin family copper-binding protein [Gemmataceae bacterium]|nr:plastocyanin/azurin family copper-binding protein [Gemmataceae bacterium]